MRECIFCSIAKGEIPSIIIHEDEYTMGFLDIRPRSKGMTIVISKNHFQNFSENPEISLKVFNTALEIAEKIKRALQPVAVAISLMPSEIKHFHVRIYPFYENEIPLVEAKPKEMSEDELKDIARKIRESEIEKKKEEKKEEIKRTEEDIFWMRRELELA